MALEDENHRLWRLRHVLNKITLHPASLESYASLVKLIQKIKPHEVYHLGAQSYVDYSFKDEFSTLNTNINGTHYILSALKEFSPKTRFYFAGSSEMFGKVRQVPQTEKTPFYPRSVYGISKVVQILMTLLKPISMNMVMTLIVLMKTIMMRAMIGMMKMTTGMMKMMIGRTT